jgi:hypothetical protein
MVHATIAGMKLLILYRPHSEYSRSVEEFAQNLERVYPGNHALLTDADSSEGAQQAELYDIWQYPAILVLADDGGLVHSWLGSSLPLIDSVVGYLRS